MAKDAMNALNALRNDRLIELQIGAPTETNTPFLVQQQLLESTSDYFVKALNRENFLEGQTGRLYFPDDDEEAWSILLHWILFRDVEDGETLPAAKAWVLADKYNVVGLQDALMIRLLAEFECNFLDAEVLHYIINNTSEISNLRRLAIFDMVQYLQKRHSDTDVGQLQIIAGHPVLFQVLKLCGQVMTDKSDTGPAWIDMMFDLSYENAEKEHPTWKGFMVGDASMQHRWFVKFGLIETRSESGKS